MTIRVQLGWRVPAGVWERFEDFVVEKHGSAGQYLRFEMECAMREFLDEDDLLAQAEELLDRYADLRALSSSTPVTATDRYQGATTRKVSHRINADLKERFQIFADEHEAPSYGRLLAAALDSYADGGRARRLLEDVERLVTGGTSCGTTDDAVESDSDSELSTATDCGTTAAGVERDAQVGLSTPTTGGTSDGTTDNVFVEARHVIAIAEELPNDIIPKRVLDETIADIVGDGTSAVIEAHREAALEQVSAAAHPHRDGVYITDEYRESTTLWADLDKAERIVLLRRFVADIAVEDNNRKQAFDYKDVQGVFEAQCGGGGPSHQYAYKLMEAAADEPGFKYGTSFSSDQLSLRVDLKNVSDGIVEYLTDNHGQEALRGLGVDSEITSYTVGSPPQQEGMADD